MNTRLILAALILSCLVAACSNSTPTGPVTTSDTLGTITFVLDTVTRRAFVDTSRVASGVLNSSARWNEQVFTPSGIPVTLLLRCGVSIPDSLGTYSVATKQGVFYALLGVGDVSGVSTVHYRADDAGGSGTITVTSVDSAKTKGNFDVIAYNESKTSDTKHVTGSFEVQRK